MSMQYLCGREFVRYIFIFKSRISVSLIRWHAIYDLKWRNHTLQYYDKFTHFWKNWVDSQQKFHLRPALVKHAHEIVLNVSNAFIIIQLFDENVRKTQHSKTS